MTNLDKALSKVFDVAETVKPVLEVAVVDAKEVALVGEVVDELDEDVEFVRNKLKSLLSSGELAFDTLNDIAKAEERISAFEAITGMMGQLKDVSLALLEIQDKKEKIKERRKKEAGPAATSITNNIDNAVFVGTTAELQKMIRESSSNTIDETKP